MQINLNLQGEARIGSGKYFMQTQKINTLEIHANVERFNNLPWNYFGGILLDHHDAV